MIAIVMLGTITGVTCITYSYFYKGSIVVDTKNLYYTPDKELDELGNSILAGISNQVSEFKFQ